MIKVEQDRLRVYRGIRANADIVGSTMGPFGMNVTVDFGQGMATFKDGVSVSKLMHLPDEFENLGSAMVSAACRRTVEEAGDGTTSTAVMTAAMCDTMEKGFEIEREMRSALQSVEGIIKDLAIPVVKDGVVDGDMLEAVATISANGRKDLGEMIGRMAAQLGVYGQISVEEGLALESEVFNGYTYQGKVLALQFNNKPGRMEVEDCYVSLVNEEIDSLAKLKPLLMEYNNLAVKKPLVIFAGGMSGQALATLAGNIERFRSGQQSNEIYVLSAPSFGEERHLMMEDMSVICNTPVFNHMRGIEIKEITKGDGAFAKTFMGQKFGLATKVKVSNGRVFIFAERSEKLEAHIEALKEIEGSEKRLAMLTGGIGVIRVGGSTEMEVASDRELVEDAVRAVYAAMDGGVVPGAGRCLEFINHRMSFQILSPGRRILLDALLAPIKQLWKNAGKEYIRTDVNDPWICHDIHTGQAINLKEAKVLDPAKVVLSSVKNACSAASQFITTEYFLSYR